MLQLLTYFVNLFCSGSLSDPFPQHVAAVDKALETETSLKLSPLIVQSILDLYVDI